MGSDLLVLLVLAVASGAGDPPASMASSKTTAVRELNSSEVHRVTDGPHNTELSSRRRVIKAVPSRLTNSVSRGASAVSLASAQESRVVDEPANRTPIAEVVESPLATTESCSCASCAEPRGHHYRSGWGIVGLPNPCVAPGDMTLHIPYLAHPKNYYYFRPYNYFHIADQQREVANYGGDHKHPYDNRLFGRVYARTVDPYENDGQPELINPIPRSQLR